MRSDGPLYIALTCDAVSDYFDRSMWAGHGSAPLSWRGVEQGIGAILDAIRPMRDSKGCEPSFTWFVPVDNYMERQYGDVAFLLTEFAEIWDACRRRGDEIAWHVYQHKCSGEQWYPEDNYDEWDAGLKHCKIRLEELGIPVKATRVGGTHCSNRVMQTLEELAISCDMTALPGRVRREGPLQLDWEPTPETPYYPSREDYRVPGMPGVDILEIPLSMVPVKAEYDAAPFRRYVDLSFHHKALWPGLEKVLKAAPEYLATIVHPSAILNGIAGDRHGLLSFDLGELVRNLESVIKCCSAMGRPYEFVTVAELANVFQAR